MLQPPPGLPRTCGFRVADQLIVEHHYLKRAELVGEQRRYVATCKGRWLALAAWSAPALHLKARDAFIGWTAEQRRTRLPLLANNSSAIATAARKASVP